jgi:hypothetical protein
MMRNAKTAGPVNTTAMGRPFDLSLAARLLGAGIASLLAWEAFARLVAPVWIGGPLDPSGLIQAALGIESATLAQMLHVLTGLIGFPAGYVLVVEPAVRRVMPVPPWPVLGAAYGVGLWVFAMYCVAHLLAGFPAFLDWQPVAWASLVGHVALGLTLTGVLAWSRRTGV